MAVPLEIRLNRAEKALVVTFDNGIRHEFPAEYLRVESPSAEVQGHGPGERRIPGGKSEVGIIGVEAIGNYAVRILFDDGHDTGIYSWELLGQLADERERRWAEYLQELQMKGLNRYK